MKRPHTVWLASYPRSGNTLLRTILWQCFSFRSGSIYLNDLDDNHELEEYVGHIERTEDRQLIFPARAIPFVKTHEPDSDDSPAIYVIRDGRAVMASLWRFYRDRFTLDDIIAGRNHNFGTWRAHIESWQPWSRRETLLLRYEDLVGNLQATLNTISGFLNIPILKDSIPDRNTIAATDGKVVRKKSDWHEVLNGEPLDRFMQANGDLLEKLNYVD